MYFAEKIEICKMKKNIIRNFFVLILLVILVIYGCPIYKHIGILCPACGTTRAWLSFLSGNITKAFKYNLFFPIMPIIIIFFTLPNKTKYANYLLFTSAGIIFFYNVLRWFNLFAMPI